MGGLIDAIKRERVTRRIFLFCISVLFPFPWVPVGGVVDENASAGI